MSPPLQEGMLKDLQKSVEEEERVWKAKVGAAEEELQKVWLAYITPPTPKLPGPRIPPARFSRLMSLLFCSHGSQ